MFVCVVAWFGRFAWMKKFVSFFAWKEACFVSARWHDNGCWHLRSHDSRGDAWNLFATTWQFSKLGKLLRRSWWKVVKCLLVVHRGAMRDPCTCYHVWCMLYTILKLLNIKRRHVLDVRRYIYIRQEHNKRMCLYRSEIVQYTNTCGAYSGQATLTAVHSLYFQLVSKK